MQTDKYEIIESIYDTIFKNTPSITDFPSVLPNANLDREACSIDLGNGFILTIERV